MTTLTLALAILFEAGWAIAMKLSDGFRKPGPAVVTVILYLLSVVFLSQATKKLDVGLGYAIWAGAGAVLIALAGIFYFKEPASVVRLCSMGLIVLGIAGLGLSGRG